MGYAEDFENLERANAQIDIWIDEEEYGEVERGCRIHKALQEDLNKAFAHEHCTDGKDDEWLAILTHSEKYPVIAIDITTQRGDKIDIGLSLNAPRGEKRACDGSDMYEAWSHFLWAKLIRAKIQQKGTDCYFRRLDQVLAYLGRHCPPVQPLKQDGDDGHKKSLLSNILAVIYLLEMAACGEAADQRSFAERGRRILRDKGGDGSFYDFLARYNIGVGYFHEGAYRKAVREFNLIIQKLKPIWDNEGNFTLCPGTMEHSIHQRLGRKLLYLPSVLYRAEIQLKLQLAYHAQRTIAEYVESPGRYKQAQANLIKAEAYQQMGRWQQVWQTLCEVYGFTHSGTSLKCERVIQPFSAEPGSRFANLKGRLQELLIAYCMNEVEEAFKKIKPSDVEGILDYLNRFFYKYKWSILHQRENRSGYFEQLAKYIAFLTEKSTERDEEKGRKSSKAKEAAKEVFNKNKKDILASENERYACPCEEKGIDLRRLDQDHFDTFTKNMQKFFREFIKLYPNDLDLQKSQKNFLDRLENLEKEARENLVWRIRKIKLERDGDPIQFACKNCFPCNSRSKAFANLLKCMGNCDYDGDKRNSESLNAKDYQQIMDHWDEHFLEHMRDPSFHAPRCRALHFLGLQRWNSTSPAQGRSLGGGYLVYHTDKRGCIDLGVAIDPGFDFVRNLFHMGFSLADIDIVLLSHAHVDHVRDFESMVTLLLELHKRTKNNKRGIKRKLHAIMTLGVYRRLEYIIESPGLREYVEPYILDIEKEINKEFLKECNFEFMQEDESSDNQKDSEPNPQKFAPVLSGDNAGKRRDKEKISVRITPTKAYHNDFSEYSDSFGFIINIKYQRGWLPLDYSIGYTGDTSWNSDIMKQYVACDSLLVHLGSLIDREKEERKNFNYYKENGKECFKLIQEKNHPYLMGMLHFLREVWTWTTRRQDNKPLVLISEFGEELRGRIRLDLIDRLKRTYGLNILPVDIGLDVLLAFDSNCEDLAIRRLKDRKDWKSESNLPAVWCVQCRRFIPLEDVDFTHYGHDEALFCVCATCKKATPHNVLQERLRVLYEVGRRLQTH